MACGPALAHVRFESYYMLKDFEWCPHCKQLNRDSRVIRFGQSPLISRSDGETFHLYLFAGPIDWLAKNGKVVPDKAVCNFVHRSENQGLDRSSVVLFDVPVIGEVEHTLRDAADQMAEILARQKFLQTNLQYRNGKLDDLDWSFLA
jgi:hypothetical protein